MHFACQTLEVGVRDVINTAKSSLPGLLSQKLLKGLSSKISGNGGMCRNMGSSLLQRVAPDYLLKVWGSCLPLIAASTFDIRCSLSRRNTFYMFLFLEVRFKC